MGHYEGRQRLEPVLGDILEMTPLTSFVQNLLGHCWALMTMSVGIMH